MKTGNDVKEIHCKNVQSTDDNYAYELLVMQ